MAVTTASVTAAVSAAFTYIGASAAWAATLATITVQLVTNAVITAALAYGSSLLISAPRLSAAAQKQVFNQAVANRIRYVGEVKVGGPRAFFVAKDGSLYQVIMLNSGPATVVVHWLASDVLTLNADGAATDPVRYTFHGQDFVIIKVQHGSIGQEAFKILMDDFPGEWTADHRLRGVTCVLVKLLSPIPENFSRVFPTGLPRYNAVLHAGKFWDPRDTGTDIDDSDIDGTITAVAHGFVAPSYDAGTDTWTPGDTVIIRGHDATYVNLSGSTVTLDGYFEVATAPSADTFTVFDPITGDVLALVAGGTGVGTVTKCNWTRNGVLIVMDYLWHQDGARLPRSRIELGIDSWKAQADIADEDIPLKAGGTEKRYSLSGGYEIPSPPKTVLPHMLVPMDARLNLRNDGAIVIDVGKWTEPSGPVLTGDHILDYSDLRRARPREELRNEIRSKFVSAAYEYEEAEADPWIDARSQASIDTDGLLTFQLDQFWCPSHAQARRRMKVESYRQNPTWSGQIVTDATGLLYRDKRFIKIEMTDGSLVIDHVFEILHWGPFNVLNGNCPMIISAMPEEAYAWDPDIDEGTAPVFADPPEGGSMAAPAAFDAVGDSGRLFATCDDPGRPDVTFYCEWRLSDGGITDEDATWVALITDNQTNAHSLDLADDTYDCRGQFLSIGGSEGAFAYVRDIVVTSA
jgi:hypothetical protein